MKTPSTKVVEPGRTVSVNYRLELDGGVTVDLSTAPVRYVHGSGDFPASLQKALAGKRAGDVVTVTLPPEDALGARNEALVLKLPRAQFTSAEPLALGERLEGRREGQNAGCLITALDDATVTVDFNDALAGATLMARLRIDDVS